MRKTVIILSLLCLQALTAGAKGITASFRGVPLSEALASIASQQKEYRVQFIFSDLEEFSVSADIVSSGVVEAIREVIGNLPVRVTAQGKDIFVDRLLDEGGNISGRLIDKKGQAVSYASVALLNPSDSTVLNGMITGDEGVFSLPCTSDSLLVRISCIGFTTVYLPASSGNLGDIRLEHNAMMMEQLEVNASNIVHLQDKDVIYITKEMRKGSYDTAELLGKIPGMAYDKATDRLRYQGQTKILLLIDSLKYSAYYTKHLHHMRFDKIEVIPNPQGKYSGYDVVINLCRKEKYQGYENQGRGMSNLSPGSRNMLGRSLGHGDWRQTFTYTHNKWNFYTDYFGSFSQDGVNTLYYRRYLSNNYAEEVIKNPDGTRNQKEHYRTHGITAATDYQFDKHNSISLTYQYLWNNTDNNQPQTIVRSDLDGNVQDTIGSTLFSMQKWQRHSLAGFYRGGVGAWNYTASINYNKETTETGYDVEKTSGYQTIDNRWSEMNQTLAKAEVNRRFLKEKIYWSFGYNNFWKSYTQKRAETRENLSNYALKQSTVWTYGSYNFTNKANLGINASITTNKTKGDQAKDRYLSWAGSLTYYQRMKHEQWLRVNYSCGVSNPDLSRVTSYGQFSDSLTWYGGNPQLRSSVSHYARIQYYFLKCLSISVADSYKPRTFTNITTLEYGVLQNGLEGYYTAIMPQNAKSNQASVKLDLTKHINKLSFSANASYWRSSGKYNDFKHSINGGQCTAWVQYTIEKWQLTPLIHYNCDINRGAWAQGYSKREYDNLWIEFTKYLFHKKLSIWCLYILPVHLIKGNKISVSDTPAKYSHIVYTNINKRESHHIEILIKYYLYGGKSIRQYNREMSEER